MPPARAWSPDAGRTVRNGHEGAAPAAGAATWRLVRNHALAPHRFFAGLAVLAGVLSLVALLACAAGLWPVAVFCLVDALACAVGFGHAAWHATDGERVELTAQGEIDIRVMRGTREDAYRFPAAWLRLESPRGRDAALVHLSCAGVRLCIGQQVTAQQRRCFEQELRAALRALGPH